MKLYQRQIDNRELYQSLSAAKIYGQPIAKESGVSQPIKQRRTVTASINQKREETTHLRHSQIDSNLAVLGPK